MGRILKKKDPERKKRLDKDGDATLVKTGDDASSSKPAPVLKRAPAPVKPKPIDAEPGVVQKSVQFLREVRIELKKVTWPSRKQTMGSTVVVIILVMIISLFLGLVDLGLGHLMQVVLP
jgi:preprotein translocase subunit SecE